MIGRCIICTIVFDRTDIAALKCGHTFHHQCIVDWLRKSETCPTCREMAKTTDLIDQLFFDDGEDSLLSTGSSPPPASKQEQEYSDLLNKVKLLEDELEESKKSSQNKLEAWERMVRFEWRRNAQLQLELDNAKKRVDGHEMKVVTLEKDMAGLHDHIADVEKSNHDFEVANSNLTVEKKRLENDISNSWHRNAKLQLELENAKKRVDDHETKAVAMKKDIAELHDHIADVEKSNHDLEVANSNLTVEKKRLEDELEESKKPAQKFQAKSEALGNAIRHSWRRNAKLHLELDNAKKRVDDHEMKAVAMEKDIAELHDHIADVEKSNHDLEVANSNLTVENQCLNDELAAMKREMTQNKDEAGDRELCDAPRRRYNLRSSNKFQSGDGVADTKTGFPKSKAKRTNQK